MKRMFGVALLLTLLAAPARAALDPSLLAGFAGDFQGRMAAIEALGVAGGDDARRVLDALEAGRLGVIGGRAVIVDGDTVRDAASGEALDQGAGDVELVTLNNRVRRTLANARAALALTSADRAERLGAAITLGDNPNETLLPVFDRALAAETDEEIRGILARAAARIKLASPDALTRLRAVRALGESSDPAVKNLLEGLLQKRDGNWVEAHPEVRTAAKLAIDDIEGRIAIAEGVGTVFSGL
ncbi:MAG: urea ABC transporter permease subunit UrtB, partial [Proteobacteria bacterium]|nr:urea ABC transporter permease subunit UrtB [Pseudomonadota bacterium]